MQVVAGDEKGKRGEVMQVLRNQNKLVIKNLNIVPPFHQAIYNNVFRQRDELEADWKANPEPISWKKVSM